MNEPQIISKEIIEFENVYSPSSILGVYANAIRTQADSRIILAKGQYQIDPNQREYGGYFYDSIKSPNDSKSIKIKITGQHRGKLQKNLIYIFKGYIEKRISFSSIELVLVVDDVHRHEENPFTEEDIKRFELLQKKISKGFRDLEAVIKEHIYNNTKPKIANIYGTTAIVDKDFEHGIGESMVRFNISKHRCNITSKSELIACIKKLSLQDFDVIAIVRGGGDKSSLEIFNDSELGNEAIKIKPLLVTALGHTVNESLLDKIADKKFALPHDYGSSLKAWVDEAIQEQDKSKSIFIEQVKKDLTKTFDEQIKTLQKQLEIKNKEFETAQLKFKEMVEQNQKDKAEVIKAKEKSFEEVTKSFGDQIKTLQKQLETKNKEFETAQIKFKEMVEQNQKDKVEVVKAKEKSFEEVTKSLSEQIKTLQKQLDTKNKEFETAQNKFNEMVKQNQKDKVEFLNEKEKAFEAVVKSLSEQIKAKEESIKVIQENNVITAKQQVAAAITEFKTKYEIALTEKTKLAEQIDQLNNSKPNMIVYVIISIIIGFVIGFIMRK